MVSKHPQNILIFVCFVLVRKQGRRGHKCHGQRNFEFCFAFELNRLRGNVDYGKEKNEKNINIEVT